MKKKNIHIPIYDCQLTMILDKDLSRVEKKYNTDSLKKFRAVTIRTSDSHYVVAFTTRKDFAVISHEVVHVKNHIFLDCGIEADCENDEPEAYLTDWLFTQIYEFLKKNKK